MIFEQNFWTQFWHRWGGTIVKFFKLIFIKRFYLLARADIFWGKRKKVLCFVERRQRHFLLLREDRGDENTSLRTRVSIVVIHAHGRLWVSFNFISRLSYTFIISGLVTQSWFIYFFGTKNPQPKHRIVWSMWDSPEKLKHWVYLSKKVKYLGSRSHCK